MNRISWTNLYQSCQDKYGSSLSELKALRNANDALDELKGIANLPTQIRESFIPYVYAFERYKLPTDFKTQGHIALKYDDKVDNERNRIFVNEEPFNQRRRWHFLDPTEWNDRTGIDIATIKPNKGVEALWLANGESSQTNQIISNCEATTGWTAASGASNLAVDSDVKVFGSYSLNYDLTAATTPTLTLLLTTAIDLSDYVDKGVIRLYKWLPTAPTQIEIQVGETSSKYYTQTITTQADGQAFDTLDVNELEFSFPDATLTGAPDMSACTHFKLILTFGSATTDTDFRIDEIVAYKPTYLAFEYYSYYMVQTAAGVWQENFTVTAGTDEYVNLLPQWKRALVAGIILPELEKDGDARAASEFKRWNEFKTMIQNKYPNRAIREGNSYW